MPRRSSTASPASKRRCRGVYQLAQGGTAVGTGINAAVGFDDAFAEQAAS